MGKMGSSVRRLIYWSVMFTRTRALFRQRTPGNCSGGTGYRPMFRLPDATSSVHTEAVRRRLMETPGWKHRCTDSV